MGLEPMTSPFGGERSSVPTELRADGREDGIRTHVSQLERLVSLPLDDFPTELEPTKGIEPSPTVYKTAWTPYPSWRCLVFPLITS